MRIVSWLGVMSLVFGLVVLSGCNTIKGVGQDIHDSAAQVQTWVEAETQDN